MYYQILKRYSTDFFACQNKSFRLRVPGVLQRFGVAYFVVALVGNLLTRAHRPPSEKEAATGEVKRHLTDLTDLLPHWLVMVVVLVMHQLVVWLVPAPGCPQVGRWQSIYIHKVYPSRLGTSEKCTEPVYLYSRCTDFMH